jgi:hypothetical protein
MLTLLSSPWSVFANSPSSVFIVNPPPFFTVTCKLRVAVIRCRLTFQNLSLTCAFTSFSFAIYASARGSCFVAGTNLPWDHARTHRRSCYLGEAYRS